MQRMGTFASLINKLLPEIFTTGKWKNIRFHYTYVHKIDTQRKHVQHPQLHF
jgi:hypothetical protein